MLKERLSAYIANSGRTKKAVADAIGISASALTNYLTDKYQAKDLSSIEGKIETFLNKVSDREQLTAPVDVGFVPIESSGNIFEIADYSRLKRRIGVVVGEAGVGKTTACREYARQHSDTVIIFAHRSMTQKSLFKAIAKQIGVDERGLTCDIFARVAQHLGDRLLIIDEAEHLSIPMLDELRRLNDPEFGNSGLLLVGLPRFVELIRSRQHDYAYLRNRINQSVTVTNMCLEDTSSIVRKAFPEFASVAICKCFHKFSGGNPRRLIKLIDATYSVAQVNNICAIDELLIESAAQMVEF